MRIRDSCVLYVDSSRHRHPAGGGLRPQATFRISRRCFEFGERTDIRGMLPVPPGQARPHQLVIEDAAIGEDDIGHCSPVAV